METRASETQEPGVAAMRCGWGRRPISPFADPERHTLDAACGRPTETIYDASGRLTPVCAECAPAAIRAGAFIPPQGR